MTLVVWVLFAVVVALGIGVAKFIVAGKRKAEAKARSDLEASLRAVPPTCRTDGHAYHPFATGYRCSTCGNYVSSSEGQTYGLTKEGRVDRRRQQR
jgi:hypothetical protein